MVSYTWITIRCSRTCLNILPFMLIRFRRSSLYTLLCLVLVMRLHRVPSEHMGIYACMRLHATYRFVNEITVYFRLQLLLDFWMQCQ